MEIPLSTRFALLLLLRQRPGYGLELIERARGASGGSLVLLEGAVYPALRSLERGGLVESYEDETAPARGGRPKVYYRITGPGRLAAAGHQTSVAALFDTLAPAGA